MINALLPFRNAKDSNGVSTEPTYNDFDVCVEALKHFFQSPRRKQKLSKYSLSDYNLMLLSSFAEFELMFNIYKFDILTLSETWLRNNEHAINYAQISGYNLEINSRNTGRGGDVDFYIKDKITYKRRQDIINIDNTVEHLWTEVRGTNKNNPYLMGTFYQPTPKDSEKEKWLGKFENIISQILIEWDGFLVLAGDL